MLTVPEASANILADIRPMSIERVPLLDALGRVLATGIVSPITLPPWTNSAMDGYAVRADDLAAIAPGRSISLEVIETVVAGAFATRSVGVGEAIRIMTGAPLPDGADTVVRVEDTDAGTSRVEIRDARDARRNIRPRGEDLHEGDVVLPRGAVIGAAQLGVLASVGA